jgi:transporter family protein
MTELMLVLTILFWGIAPIFDKAALRDGTPLNGTIVRGLTVGIIMLAVMPIGGRTRAIAAMPGRTVLYFVLSGLFAGLLGMLTYFKALQCAPTSRIVPLASIYPPVTAVLGVVLLGESVTPARAAGIILIIAGILLVK